LLPRNQAGAQQGIGAQRRCVMEIAQRIADGLGKIHFTKQFLRWGASHKPIVPRRFNFANQA